MQLHFHSLGRLYAVVLNWKERQILILPLLSINVKAHLLIILIF